MKPIIDETSRISPAQDQVFTELNGEMVLLNTKSGVYYGLDETGSRIWSLLQDSNTPKGILKSLLNAYEADPATCKADLFRLLTQLNEAGLIEVHGP